LQHVSPQHCSFCSQQWLPQHFSGFLPCVQQSRPHAFVLFGQLHVPVFVSHSLAGGQQPPAQQLSSGLQHVERLSF
jgi:hypothetical protein